MMLCTSVYKRAKMISELHFNLFIPLTWFDMTWQDFMVDHWFNFKSYFCCCLTINNSAQNSTWHIAAQSRVLDSIFDDQTKTKDVFTGHALGIWICGCSLYYKRELWASKSLGAHSTKSLKISGCKRWCPKDLLVRAPVLTRIPCIKPNKWKFPNVSYKSILSVVCFHFFPKQVFLRISHHTRRWW